MISAVIPLPNFLTQRPNILMAPRSDTYEDSDYLFTRTRSLTLRTNSLFKYKLVLSEVMPSLMGSKQFLRNPNSCLAATEIVLLSTSPIDINTYESDPYGIIYPIYGKCCGQTFVFPTSIQRLMIFLAGGETYSEIISPLQFITSMMPECTGIPIDENFFAYRAPPLFWKYSFEDAISFMRGDAEGIDCVISELLNPSAMFPKFFMIVASALSWQPLKMYVNAFADRTDNARNAMVGTMPYWPSIYLRLARAGRMLMTPDQHARMDLLIHYAQTIGDDFFVVVDMSEKYFDIPDMYLSRVSLSVNFEVAMPQRSERIKEFVRLLYQAVGRPWAGRKLHIHKTYAEDIIVKDVNTDEILLYVDLVWWTIACGNSLINQIPKEVLR